MDKDFIWCLHCERVYKFALKKCPYCGGNSFMDGWDWKIVRKNNPQYSEIPKAGVCYPMYPHERSE